MMTRSFTLLVVLAAMSLCVIALVGVQASSFRQAAAARETVAAIRASWAARAGLEAALAALESASESGSSVSPLALFDDLARDSEGWVEGASWLILHETPAGLVPGPADAHAKINVNLMSRNDLLMLDGMTEDMADSILDWIDADDSPRSLGAESGYYSQLPSPIEPRNGPVQSLFELELVAGVLPDLVRGEDWNLNAILDPNEDDGDASWPPDNADGILDAGWSEFATAASREPALASTGEPKLDLKRATAEQLLGRVPTLSRNQTIVILDYAARGNNRIDDLLGVALSTIAQQGAGLPTNVGELRRDQLADLLDQCTFHDVGSAPVPGRVNINTVTRETLDRMSSISAGLADSLILARDSQPAGFASITELSRIPALTPNRLRQLARLINVETGALVLCSRGRDAATGIEVQITATIDRTGIPVAISEAIVQ